MFLNFADSELVADRDSEDSPSSPNGALIKIPAVITRSKLVYEPEAGHWALGPIKPAMLGSDDSASS